MKHTLTVLAALLPIGVASAAWYEGAAKNPYAETESSSLKFEESSGVDPLSSTPSERVAKTGNNRAFIPNKAYFEYFGNMSVSSQPSHLHIFNAFMELPLTSTGEVSFAGWHLDATASVRATWFDASGADMLDEKRLYTLGLRAGLAHQVGQRSQIQFGGIAQFSSDFDAESARSLYWGCYAVFSSQHSENLRYSLGLAFVPGFYDCYVCPMVNLAWRFTPGWQLDIQASRFAVNNVANEKFHWGPFLQWNSSIWTVHRDHRTEQFRMTNVIAGMGATYDIATSFGANVSLLGDLGCSFYNTFRVRDRSGDHTLEKYRAHPGVYVRFGAKMEF